MFAVDDLAEVEDESTNQDGRLHVNELGCEKNYGSLIVITIISVKVLASSSCHDCKFSAFRSILYE